MTASLRSNTFFCKILGWKFQANPVPKNPGILQNPVPEIPGLKIIDPAGAWPGQNKTKKLFRQKEQKSWTKWEKSCPGNKKSYTWLSSLKHSNYVISIISTGTLSSGAWKLGELNSLSLRCCLRQVMPIIIIILLHINITVIDYSADYHYHIDYWL